MKDVKGVRIRTGWPRMKMCAINSEPRRKCLTTQMKNMRELSACSRTSQETERQEKH